MRAPGGRGCRNRGPRGRRSFRPGRSGRVRPWRSLPHSTRRLQGTLRKTVTMTAARSMTVPPPRRRSTPRSPCPTRPNCASLAEVVGVFVFGLSGDWPRCARLGRVRRRHARCGGGPCERRHARPADRYGAGDVPRLALSGSRRGRRTRVCLRRVRPRPYPAPGAGLRPDRTCSVRVGGATKAVDFGAASRAGRQSRRDHRDRRRRAPRRPARRCAHDASLLGADVVVAAHAAGGSVRRSRYSGASLCFLTRVVGAHDGIDAPTAPSERRLGSPAD